MSKKKKMLKSILTRNILLVSLVPILISTSILIVYLIQYVYGNQINKQMLLLDSLESSTKMVYEDMSNILFDADSNIEEGIISDDNINEYFHHLIKQHHFLNTVNYINSNGIIVNTSANDIGNIGDDVSNEDYYKATLSKGEGIYYSGILNYNNKKTIGILLKNKDGSVLMGCCSLTIFQNMIDELIPNLGNQGQFAITDSEGVYIAHSNNKKDGEIERYFNKLKDNEVQILKYDTENKIVISREIKQQGLTVINYYNFIDSFRIVKQVVIISIVCIVIIVLLSFAISFRFSRPAMKVAHDLVRETSEISRGNYNVVIEESNYYEFDKLIINFNMMSKTILEMFAELTDSHAEQEILNDELIRQNKEIQNSMQQISLILNSIYNGIMMVDKDYNILWINDNVYDFFNIKYEEKKFKTKCYQLIYNKDVPCKHCVLENIKLNKQDKASCIIKIGNRQIEETHNIAYDEGGRFVGIVKTFRDITEKVALQEKLTSAAKLEAIGRLTGGIAHDFNNILQVIMGYSDLMLTQIKESKKCTDILTKVSKINNSAKKAERLVKQLMIFSKIDQIHPVNINLNSVVNDTCNSLSEIMGDKINLQCNLKEIPEIYADALQIEQIILNLCMNAINAMPNGGILSIETFTAIRNNINFIGINIKDTGMGIPLNIRDKIYDPFFTTRELGKGTGLGLAIVLGIIEKHGGTIEFETKVDVGTTFSIYLPQASVKIFTYETDNNEIKHELLKGIRVLIAEDEDVIRALTKTALEQWGVNVIEAVDGKDAIEKFSEDSSYDLVILDVIMPNISGAEAYERIKQINKDIKVIFTTGYSNDFLDEDFNFSLQGRILQKPYKLEVLMKTIIDVLELDNLKG